MTKRIRQYVGILAAVAAYYLVHEGAHLLAALVCGSFRAIRFSGLGMQVDVYAERMTQLQMGIFCLVGALATLVCGWILIALAKRICRNRSPVFKAVMWYVSLAMLLTDPLYLSVLCGFFGGGDMNGIALLFPEIGVRMVFAAVGLVHGVIIWKKLLPEYTAAFRNGGEAQP